MSNNGSQETTFPISAQMSATTDYIRTIIGGISARMNLTNLAAQLAPLLGASVLKNKIRTVITSTGVLITDNTVLVDCTAGNVVLTLPAPSTAYDSTNTVTNSFVISQKIDAGNTVTINPNLSESIYDGSAQTSITLTTGSTVTLETDGTDWIVVGS